MTTPLFSSDEDLLAGLPLIERDPVRTAMHLKELLDIPEVREAIEGVRQMWYTKFKQAMTNEDRLSAQACGLAVDTIELIFRRIIDAGERETQERKAKEERPASLDL